MKDGQTVHSNCACSLQSAVAHRTSETPSLHLLKYVVAFLQIKHSDLYYIMCLISKPIPSPSRVA